MIKKNLNNISLKDFNPKIKDEKKDHLLIVSPIEGSPAQEAGIQSKDKIISIDNISIALIIIFTIPSI